jgi:hypothetical protein
MQGDCGRHGLSLWRLALVKMLVFLTRLAYGPAKYDQFAALLKRDSDGPDNHTA